FILEHANKQNLKALLRYALKKQSWNPHDLAPVEFVELNFDFHPEYIVRELKKAGFDVQRRVPVSFFRVGALKQNLPTNMLVGLDSVLQHSGLLYTPSVFVQSQAVGTQADNVSHDSIFACPE